MLFADAKIDTMVTESWGGDTLAWHTQVDDGVTGACGISPARLLFSQEAATGSLAERGVERSSAGGSGTQEGV